MAIPASCDAITAQLIKQTDILHGQIFRRSIRVRPIVELMMSTRGAFDNGIGISFQNVTSARNVPLDPVASRVSMGVSNGTTSPCLPTPLLLKTGQFTQEVTRNILRIQTEDFCIEDIKTEYQFRQALVNVTNQFSYTTPWVWAEWFTHDYERLAQHHITMNKDQGAVDNGTTYSTSALPTSRLIVGVFEDIYLTMEREGPDQPLGYDMDTNSPVYGVILSKEASDLWVRTSEAERQDRRYAYMGAREDSPLLPSKMPLKRRSYGGWVHYIDPYPRRFTFNGSAYVRIPTWLETSATVGFKQTLNPAWKTAPYEEVIPFHKAHYRSLAINSVTNPAPGWSFDPQNYMGDFRLLNIRNKECNPTGNIAFWNADYADAAEPLNTELGYTMLVKRCGYNTDGEYCEGDYEEAA